LSEPTISGNIEVTKNDLIEHSQNFALLQDVKINSVLVSNSFEDAYGRKFMISTDKEKRPIDFENQTWQKNTFAVVNDANMKLSDIFKSIFDFLGPEVLIADPYYFGEIEIDQTSKVYSLKDDQIAFINALVHSAIDHKFFNLSFLGNRNRSKKHISTDWLDKYKNIISGHIQLNKLENYLPNQTFSFWNSKEDFHNRYWFSVMKNDGFYNLNKCLILTNSISNMNELDILLIEEKSQLEQITRKYARLFTEADLKLTI